MDAYPQAWLNILRNAPFKIRDAAKVPETLLEPAPWRQFVWFHFLKVHVSISTKETNVRFDSVVDSTGFTIITILPVSELFLKLFERLES